MSTTHPAKVSAATAQPRPMIRHDLCGADGEPRVTLSLPGQRTPQAFPSISAALAVLASMEARA